MKDTADTINAYNSRLMKLHEALHNDRKAAIPFASWNLADHERFMIHRERASIFRFLDAIKPDARLKHQTNPETVPAIHRIPTELEQKINRLT